MRPGLFFTVLALLTHSPPSRADVQGGVAVGSDEGGGGSGGGGDGSAGGTVLALSNKPVTATSAQPWMCHTGVGCMPQLFVLGAQKSGSTSLYHWLHATVGVCGANNLESSNYRRFCTNGTVPHCPASSTKESHFFTSFVHVVPRLQKVNPSLRAIELFMELYQPWNECRTGGFVEASPDNLCDGEREAAQLYHMIPVPSWRELLRFVAVLREPIARELSAYNHQRHMHVDWRMTSPCRATKFTTFESFANCALDTMASQAAAATAAAPSGTANRSKVDHETFPEPGRPFPFFQQSHYALGLQAWSAAFGRSRVLVFEMEAMLAAPGDFQDRLARFARLPWSKSHETSEPAWPKLNEQSFEGKQHGVTCTVAARLYQQVFGAWNREVYALMRNDAEARATPPEEPEFPAGGFREFRCEE